MTTYYMYLCMMLPIYIALLYQHDIGSTPHDIRYNNDLTYSVARYINTSLQVDALFKVTPVHWCDI